VATPSAAAATTVADTDLSALARDRRSVAVPAFTDPADDRAAAGLECGRTEALSRSHLIAYTVVFVALALSAIGFAYVHFHHTAGRHVTHADEATTTSSPLRTTTTVALPTALKPAPEDAATALVSSWAAGNRAAALGVATQVAVTTLFATPYASGLALDRGCSTSFSPIVCTFGPPGGAPPTDPIYEIDVSQATGGWYVSSVKIQN
jgi:hypothetical protein